MPLTTAAWFGIGSCIRGSVVSAHRIGVKRATRDVNDLDESLEVALAFLVLPLHA